LVAFEYLPAALPLAQVCIDRLCALGSYEFNLCVGEEQSFALPVWSGADTIGEALRVAAADGRSGDIYARRLSATGA